MGQVAQALVRLGCHRRARPLLAVLVCLLVVAGCGGPAPAVWGSPGRPTPGTIGRLMDAVSASVPEAANVATYVSILDAPYDVAFGRAVEVLNARGDEVVLADSDKGYIVTKQSRHMNGLLLSYFLQFFVAFEPTQDSKARMVVKVVRMELFYANEDDLHPSGLVLAQPFLSEDAVARFIAAVSAAAR